MKGAWTAWRPVQVVAQGRGRQEQEVTVIRPFVRLSVLAALTLLAALAAVAQDLPRLSIHNTSGHAIKVQVSSTTRPQPDKWQIVPDGKTAQMSFTHGAVVLCRSSDGALSCPPYVIGSATRLRVEEQRVYGTNGQHFTALHIVTEQ